ncbi:MAG: hypothetical protein R3F49_06575 [Planctomycetota bacterium]
MTRTSIALRTLSVLALGLFATACSDNDPGSASTPSNPNGPGNGGGGGVTGPTDSLNGADLDADGDGDMIVDLPGGTDPLISAVFDRYTAVLTPNGGRVHLLAQAGVADAKLRRAREVLRQHLTNTPGTSQGADKADVANMMATHRATLALFRDQSSANPSDPAISAFVTALGDSVLPLLANRVILEGSPEYMAALPAEDNTFGVTAALIYRTGLTYARPAYAAELLAMSNARVASGAFTTPANAPAAETDDALVVVALDVHSGVFAHGPRVDGRGGNEYLYAFDSRADMAAGDPALLAWIEAFFATEHRFAAVLEPTFSGTFDGLFRTSTPYSNRSQYLRNIELTGSNTSELFGGPGDKTLRGNAGNNNLKGRAGDDLLFGGAGFDTAIFSGPLSNYTITMDGPRVIIEDVVGGHDGRDVLEGIERLNFTDQAFNL